MAWSRRAGNGLPPTRKRGKVQWTDKSGAKPAPFAQNMPRYVTGNEPVADVSDHFEIGALFAAVIPLSPDATTAERYPRLSAYYWDETALVKRNGLLIYTGEARVEERNKDGRIITALRHTFFTGNGRYIIVDFDLIVFAG